jgi:hypothetical protein
LNLVYRDKPGELHSYSLESRSKVTIGREEGRDLVIAEPPVSRLHATIENVRGAYFLRDSGSANGTFLNGLRLTGTSAIMLREGDVIEIGSTCFVFTKNSDAGRTPHRTASSDGQETNFSIDDLILDGLAAFKTRADEYQADWEEALAHLAREPGPKPLERVLNLVVLETRVDGAAVFFEQENGVLAPRCALPNEHSGKRLTPIATRTFAGAGGRLFCPKLSYAPSPSAGTDTITTPRSHTTAAAPFRVSGESRTNGVLAVERFVPRLDRTDVALLAVMADRIGRALAPGSVQELNGPEQPKEPA